MPTPAKLSPICCSFCGKEQQAHGVRVIAGPTVNICEECTELCADILHEEGVMPSPQGACGFAFEMGRLLEENRAALKSTQFATAALATLRARVSGSTSAYYQYSDVCDPRPNRSP